LAGFTLGARFDSSVAMGPVLATLDEILDPYRLELTVRIDGKEHCRLGCAGLSRSLEEKLEELERDRLLRPGIVIALPVGSVPVSSGETIEIEAGPIGTLRNRVA
jgi:2-keto-4-pentenoate hydratase/2-oxohepta-3-ene-1,7-dioic acid hydratase in catechol pathway